VLANFKNSSPHILTISEILRELGYRRGAFTGDAGVSAVLGYDKGFETYYDQVKFGGFANSAKLALEWLDSLDKKDPFFLFVHGYDAHGQFEIPANYQNRFEPKTSRKFKGTIKEQETLRENGLNNKLNDITDKDVQFWRSWYDTKIRDLDDRLESFIESLKKRGRFDNTIFVIFADHGTEFYEHQRFDHGHSLYDELLRVPMVFLLPNLRGGNIFSEQVSTLDILPTVLDLINFKVKEPLAAQMKGRSLVNSFLTKKLNGTDVFSETDYRNYSHKRSLRTRDGWKYIFSLETGRAELYNWKNDSGEQKNLIEREPRQGEVLRNRLNQHIVTTLKSNTDVNPSQPCLPVYKGQCE
jgi:arylsulfatase A-like enzyme